MSTHVVIVQVNEDLLCFPGWEESEELYQSAKSIFTGETELIDRWEECFMTSESVEEIIAQWTKEKEA